MRVPLRPRSNSERNPAARQFLENNYDAPFQWLGLDLKRCVTYCLIAIHPRSSDDVFDLDASAVRHKVCLGWWGWMVCFFLGIPTDWQVAIFTAGFPCTPHTSLGEKKGLDDPNAGQMWATIDHAVDMEPGVTWLLLSVLRCTQHSGQFAAIYWSFKFPTLANCKAIMLENVPGFLKAWPTVEAILDEKLPQQLGFIYTILCDTNL